jgi:glycosyltransferase involved in cell wall biosynthesis
VIVGRPTDYYKELKALIAKHRLDSRVLFLTDVPTEDLPGIYQMAEVFVYPSLFEGFGIPIIEALQSKVPVVTSKGSCFAETGGPDSCYVSPDNVEELAEVLRQTLDSYDKRNFMIRSGLQYAEKFSDSHIAHSLMNVYRQIQ